MERVGMGLVMCLILLLHPLMFIHANDEVDALKALKNRLIDSRNYLQSWDPNNVNPCAWFQVTCNTENLVTRIDLGNLNLSGTLVPNLKVLTSLQYLKLYDNNLSGTIPKELGEITSLVSLDLYNNSLTGGIPDSVGSLTNLRFLLTGSIPQSLANIGSLTTLDLSYNDLSGEVPMSATFTEFKQESD
ncbi:protein kinase superfamily [Castilleja foliolosa]|uniref:Protein kinase superfamily n=1 Tax=Castilleja foliolosa TaxID=1961234 RepID=A0ABD3CPV7_9LAMI